MALEQYFIDKYNPWVIDLSKYFMGDQNSWENLNGAHFEKQFYRETFFSKKRRGYEEDLQRKFDVESALELFYTLLDEEDVLWINILDKLNTYAPEDERVIELVQCMHDISCAT